MVCHDGKRNNTPFSSTMGQKSPIGGSSVNASSHTLARGRGLRVIYAMRTEYGTLSTMALCLL